MGRALAAEGQKATFREADFIGCGRPVMRCFAIDMGTEKKRHELSRNGRQGVPLQSRMRIPQYSGGGTLSKSFIDSSSDLAA